MKLTIFFIQVVGCLVLLASLEQHFAEAHHSHEDYYNHNGNNWGKRTTTKSPKTTTKAPKTTTKAPKTTTKAPKTTSKTSTTNKPTTTTKKPTTTKADTFRCPTKNNNGVYADPEDCTHYYVCTNGDATNQACGPVLSVFDPSMGRCRLPVFIPSCIIGK